MRITVSVVSVEDSEGNELVTQPIELEFDDKGFGWFENPNDGSRITVKVTGLWAVSSTACPECGTNGDHYCPADVATS